MEWQMIRRTKNQRRARRTAVAVTLLGVAAQACLSAAPAQATLTGPGVSAGKNITVFHNLDFVGVFGYGPVGEQITVDVIRDGVTIGTATGPAVDTPEGPGLEVNHGPEGEPQPGDCWSGATPDIRPGDRVVVTSAGVQNEVTVDNIRFTGQPAEDPTTGDVVVSGVAQRADGTTIPPSLLDSGEFRDNTGKYRITPDVVEATAGVTGGFTMRYRSPYTGFRNESGLTEAQRKLVLLSQDGHAIGFGHTEPLPAESMLVDGIADVTGPAVGCDGSPPPTGEEDETAPTVTSRTPTAGATQVALGQNVVVGFSEPVTGVDRTTFTLTGASGQVAASVSYNTTTRVATLVPSAPLAEGTTYTVALGDTVSDIAGNFLGPVNWTFTTAQSTPSTGDTVSPTVVSRSPNSGATRVSRDVNVTVTFSEPITGLSPTSMTLRSNRGNRNVSVPATVTYDPGTRRGTLNPTQTLDRNTRYTVALTNGIVDLAGNRLGAQTWSFTTRN
jgi:LysM repeat protein